MTVPVHSEPRWTYLDTTDWSEAETFGSSAFFSHSIEPVDRHATEMNFHMETMEIEGGTVGRSRYGAALRLACDPLDGYHVVIPLRGSLRTVSDGQILVADPANGAMFNPSIAATLWRSSHSEHLVMKLDRANFERELALLLGRSVTSPIVFDTAIDLGTPGARRWLGGLHLLGEGLDDHRIFTSQGLLAAQLRNLMVLGLLHGQRHNYTGLLADRSTGRSSVGTAKRAMTLIEEDPRRPWTVGMLALECGSSVRALQESFRRTVGVTPIRFLTSVRLDHVHRQLSTAEPASTTVSSIAHAWGFGHLGRFAQAYQQQFGTHPSETLRAAGR